MEVGFWSISPVLLVIIISLWTKKVHLGLLTGIVAAALMVFFQKNSNLSGNQFEHFFHLVSNPIFNKSHFGIIVFTSAIAASINILSKNGSLTSLMAKISRKAESKRKTMLTTYFLGLLIFFDDYTNSLLIGNLMRSQFDRFKISREKLAYIIDSTSAPVASLAIMSTWIGFELGEIQETMSTMNLNGDRNIPENAYFIFINSLPYSYYTILTLLTVLIVIWIGKDFGPMKRFESEASQAKIEFQKNAMESPQSPAWVSIISLSAFIIITAGAMLYSGYSVTSEQGILNWNTLKIWLGNADTTTAIVIGASSALLLSFSLSLYYFKPKVIFTWTYKSIIKILSPLAVLYLAWIFSEFISALNIVDFIKQVLASNYFDSRLFPATVFIASAVISFSTGSSWGTMSIMFPLCLPISYELAFYGHETETPVLFYSAVASILSGAVWGDHCSPISDTTIISSISADCDHLNHVKSQLPYAALTGIVSLVGCLIPINFGFSNLLAFTISTIVTILIFSRLGRKSKVLRRQKPNY